MIERSAVLSGSARRHHARTSVTVRQASSDPSRGSGASTASRWVGAAVIGGIGLVGLGYSLATRPTPAPAPVLVVPAPMAPRAGEPMQAPRPSPDRLPGHEEGRPGASGLAATPARDGDQATKGLAGSDAPDRPGLRIDLNTASAEQLQLLPGIGPARAAAIIESRRQQGPFASIDDLARVRGIGPATIEGLRPYAVAHRPAPAPEQAPVTDPARSPPEDPSSDQPEGP